MARDSKNPAQSDPAFVSNFSGLVKPGEYALFGSSDIPQGVPWGGDQCRGVVLAASTMGPFSLRTVAEAIAPRADVYLLRYFRTYPGSAPPRKVDDALYWLDPSGNCWSLHSKDSPDHHREIMSSTGLEGLIDDMDLPAARRGTLAEYRQAGAYLDFENPFNQE